MYWDRSSCREATRIQPEYRIFLSQYQCEVMYGVGSVKSLWVRLLRLRHHARMQGRLLFCPMQGRVLARVVRWLITTRRLHTLVTNAPGDAVLARRVLL